MLIMLYSYSINIGVLMFCLVLLGCLNEGKKSINEFFSLLEGKLENTKILEDIKSREQDSLFDMLPIFRGVYSDLIEELNYEKEWPSFIDTNFARTNYSLMDEILLCAFQKHLNNKQIDLKEIQIDIKESSARNERLSSEQSEKYKNELVSIIRTNNENWNEGDTLKVILQLSVDADFQTIYYRSYPNSLDYSSADDTLDMKGLLLSKFYSNFRSGYPSSKLEDPLNLFFKIKILELNHGNDNKSFSQNLEIGGEFILHLESYGRPIQ